jgi:LacI family transcriptional regulator
MVAGLHSKYTYDYLWPESIKMSNIKDIAKISGFSANTVSNALRNKDNVKKKTKKLIQKIARDLNYVPNNIARSLVSKKSFLIALVIHSIKDPFYSELIDYLESLIYSSEYNLVLFDHNEDIQRQDRIIQSILEQKIDGVIINPALSDKSVVEKLKAFNIPFVLIVRNYDVDQNNFVGIDFNSGMKKIVDHFVKYDRRSILIICGSDITHSSQMRLIGYKNALIKNNIEYDQDLVIERFNSKEHLWRLLEDRIIIKKKANAIFCYDFNTTSSALEFCKINHIIIPSELAFIGFEFENFCINSYIPLTTIKYDTDKISEIAWSVLKNLIDSNNSLKIYQNIFTDPMLIARESCGEFPVS